MIKLPVANVRISLVTNEYYHVFNRGVAKAPIFLSKNDYLQAMLTLRYYVFCNLPIKLSRFKELPVSQRDQLFTIIGGNKKLVEIISFVFMPNHFHFLVKQTYEHGISKFISQFTNSYTRYFNTKYERVGPLFQGLFKSVHVESDEQLLHLSRYIHINPVVSSIIREEQLLSYPWSSLPHFLSDDASFIDVNSILEHFQSKQDYIKFTRDQVGYGKTLQQMKHLVME